MWWPEIVVAVVIGTAVWRWARRVDRGWAAVFGVGLAVVGAVLIGRRVSGASAWLWWLIDARVNPLVMAAAVPAMMGPLVRRLPAGRQRAVVMGAMVVMGVYYSVLPGVMPMAARAAVRGGRTVIDSNGVCLQTHDFTCGPASMVTCLRELEIPAEEGEVAEVARCGPAVGTDPGVLADAVAARYGVGARSVTLRDVRAVRAPAVMEISVGLGLGHYVAVMACDGERMRIGDPEVGAVWMSMREMQEEWTGRVVEVWK
ncbi:MAG TPA: cysteine peptidase family C39 domain-containing protein [Phycisphaerae bacterium]|nr:cysteine peptidase family C39 domain-containing protein [Phycisphaerae bacterium]